MDGLKKSRIMDGVEVAKRKALETAVAALCIESGFQTAERETVGVLSEIMQSCKFSPVELKGFYLQTLTKTIQSALVDTEHLVKCNFAI